MKPSDCPCGASYDALRTGFSFADVKQLMYVASEDPADWRHKRRRSVLGFWHELKLQIWFSIHGGCE